VVFHDVLRRSHQIVFHKEEAGAESLASTILRDFVEDTNRVWVNLNVHGESLSVSVSIRSGLFARSEYESWTGHAPYAALDEIDKLVVGLELPFTPCVLLSQSKRCQSAASPGVP
jgi:hypothetical protein